MITSSDLIAAGIKPGPLFGRCLKECNTIEEALELVAANTKTKPIQQKVFMKPGSVWHWLCNNPCLQGLFSREMQGKIASNSEKRRWLEQGCIVINGKTPKPDDLMDDICEWELEIVWVEPEPWEVGELLYMNTVYGLRIPFQRKIRHIDSLVLFPNAKTHKCTMV